MTTACGFKLMVVPPAGYATRQVVTLRRTKPQGIDNLQDVAGGQPLRRYAACFSEDPVLDAVPEFGGAMKLRQPQEAMPLSVWNALGLMVIGSVIYLTGLVV